ncbi:MAG: FtsX-like permease family protein [Eubacteriales bacterium]
MTFREIRGTFGRWIAIFAIVALGVGFFAGLRITRTAMVHTTDEYLREHGFFDFRLVSTLGLTEEDVGAFAALEGVRSAAGSVSADALFSLGDAETGAAAAKFHMLLPDVNTLSLTAGRLPSAPDECVLDRKYANEDAIGKQVRIAPENDESTRELFTYSEYTVVGLANSPYYLNYERGTTSLGNGSVACFVYIPPEGFSSEVFTEIYITLDTDAGIYTQEYEDTADAAEAVLSARLTERAALRRDGILRDAEETLDDARGKLSDAEEEYRVQRADAERAFADAEAELADGAREIEENKKKLSDSEQQLADARAEIDANRATLLENEQKLADAQAEIDANRATLLENEQKLADAQAVIDANRATLLENEQKLADAQAEIDANRAVLEENRQKLADAQAEIDANRATLAESAQKLTEAQEELDEQQQAYEDGAAQLDAAQAELDAKRADWEDARQQLQAADAELETKQSELNSAFSQLDAAQAEIDAGYARIDALLQDPAYASEEAQRQLAAQRAALDAAQAELNGGWAQARAGQNELDAARLQLAENRKKLEEAGEQLETAQAEIDSRRAALPAAREALNDAQREINDGWTQYQAGLARLNDAQREVDDGTAELAVGEAKLNDAQREVDEGAAELADGKAKLEAAQREVDDGTAELADGKAKLEAAQREVNEGAAELADGKAKLEAAQREVDDGTAELADGKVKLADAEAELADGRKEYEDERARAEREFADAERKIEDARQELADGEAKLADIHDPQTYVLGRDTNTGYVCFDNDSSIVRGISRVFPIFFFLVAALVCVTTMTRMVNDQRTQIGTLKALGYGKGAIMKKYIVYSGSAALLGCILGYSAGTIIFPAVIWEVYGIMYGFGEIRFIFDWLLALISLAVSLACSVGTTWLACRHEFARVPAALMRPKAPKAGRRILLERLPLWKHVKFLHKVSIRNIVRYKKRLYMMILGIGGCTALLITGFGIRDSIQDLANFQFGEIMTYDASVTFSEPLDAAEEQAFASRHADTAEQVLFLQQSSLDAFSDTMLKQTQLLVCDGDTADAFLHLHSGKRAVAWPEQGEAVISRGLAETLGLSAGDRITLRDGDMNTLSPVVADVFDNYVFNYVILTPQTYAEGLGTAEVNTAFLLFGDEADPHAAAASLNGDDAVVNVSVSADFRERITNMLSSLDYIVILVTGCAAALAFIVLYNLTNINITERLREIATIKVLGFYRGETAAYIFRENMILTGIGAVAGLFLGKLLHAFVMSQIKVDMVHFDAIVRPVSYLASILLTFLFAVLVALFMRRKLDRINMAESLKSVE